ncbi:hypothetical protein BAE44_0022618, partial [Dichanthelium oligosanthes]
LMMVDWHLWKERNARLFQNVIHSAHKLQGTILQEAVLWVPAGAHHLGRIIINE